MVPSPDRRLFYLLSLAQRRASAAADHGLEDLGLTSVQAGALFVIKPGRCVGLSELAGALNLAQSAASALVQRLERAGFVRREPDPGDARAVRLALTDKGEAARAQAAQRARRFNAALARGLSPAELALVSAWLSRLVREPNLFELENT